MKRLLTLLWLVFFLLSGVSGLSFADLKISQLTNPGSATATDEIPINKVGTGTRKITVSNLAAYLAPLTETLTNKTLSGASNTFTNIPLSTAVTGALGPTNGGTGQTSLSAAINVLVPTQSGHAGNVLTTNGTAVSWVPPTSASCTGCGKINVQDISGVTVDNSSDDDGAALDTYLTANPTNQVVYFPKGTYEFKTSLFVDDVQNVKFECEPGAIIKKNAALDPVTVGEYLMVFRDGRDIEVSGCRFEGLTSSTTANNFGEQGILCASCIGFYVHHNKFYNFGDAAVRSTTGTRSGASADAVNTWILNNYFYNISQVTTTPAGTPVAGTGKGGTTNFWVANNVFDNLKGSVKACTRYPVYGAFILNNIINNSTALSTSTGVELCSYRMVVVDGNIITGSQSWAINDYTNGESSLNKFDWYDHKIVNNMIYDVARGIRVSNAAYTGDSLSSDTSGIVVANNTMRGVTGSGTVGITLVNGTFHGSSVHDNQMTGMTSGLYMIIPGSGVNSSNNVQD